MSQPDRKPKRPWPAGAPLQPGREIVTPQPPAPVTRPVPPPVTREARLLDLDSLNPAAPLDAQAIGWREPAAEPHTEALGLALFRAGGIVLSGMTLCTVARLVWLVCERLGG